MHSGLFPFLMDAAEEGGKLFARRADRNAKTFAGKVPSPAFFAAARQGEETALNSIERAGYKYTWDHPSLRGLIEREMTRFHRGGARPNAWNQFRGRWKGAAFGRPLAGLSRARSNFARKTLGFAVGIGGVMTAINTATAERGHAASAFLSGAGMTAGGVVGSAVGAFVGGLPGEIVGGWIGATAGEKVGVAYQALLDEGRNLRRFNAGGTYVDTSVAYTQRQRAVQELSSSLLNARQFLGREALLLHQ